jgi:hypothetical protein
MTRSAVLFLSIAFAIAGTFLDYVVGRLANNPSLGVACWAAGLVIVAGVLDFVREWHKEREHEGTPYTSRYAGAIDLTIINNLVRGADMFRWETIFAAMVAGVLAWIGAYVFTLATITIRFTDVHHGPKLGKLSPFDHDATAVIVSFQTSSAAWWFAIACFLLALVLRVPALLTLGVVGVPIANAASAALKPLTRGAVDPSGQFTQFTQSFSAPDAWFFRLPTSDIILACIAAFIAGLMVCWFINLILAPAGGRRR